jgi:hypothetical protein
MEVEKEGPDGKRLAGSTRVEENGLARAIIVKWEGGPEALGGSPLGSRRANPHRESTPVGKTMYVPTARPIGHISLYAYTYEILCPAISTSPVLLSLGREDAEAKRRPLFLGKLELPLSPRQGYSRPMTKGVRSAKSTPGRIFPRARP